MIDQAAPLFRVLDRELWVISACAGDHYGGLISTSVSQASINDQLPRLIVGLATHHQTESLVKQSKSFVAHLIASDQSDWVQHFGTQSGRDIDKFSDLEFTTSVTQAPILKDAHAWLECRVENVMESGDRHWYLAEIVDAKWSTDFVPLTFQAFLSQADDDLKALLKKQLGEDSLTDRQLVEEWRRSYDSTDY
ncbi:MAG: flavin reductase family protein [Planctomycetaceae bacterium]|nr:flavin reductase family protein [Planctomycetaceae bacterium]